MKSNNSNVFLLGLSLFNSRRERAFIVRKVFPIITPTPNLEKTGREGVYACVRVSGNREVIPAKIAETTRRDEIPSRGMDGFPGTKRKKPGDPR